MHLVRLTAGVAGASHFSFVLPIVATQKADAMRPASPTLNALAVGALALAMAWPMSAHAQIKETGNTGSGNSGSGNSGSGNSGSGNSGSGNSGSGNSGSGNSGFSNNPFGNSGKGTGGKNTGGRRTVESEGNTRTAGRTGGTNAGADAEGEGTENARGRRRRTGSQSGSTATSSGAQSSGPALSAVTMAIDRDSRVMRLVPPTIEGGGLSFNARRESEFWTHLKIDSNIPTRFDHLRVVLDYPADVIQFEGVNDLAISAKLDGEPTARVDHKRGILIYDADLADPMYITESPLMSFRWKALRTASASEIKFSNHEGNYSQLSLGGGDLIGSQSIPGDGTLSLLFDVLPTDEDEIAALEDAAAFDFGSFERTGGVKIRAEVQKEPIVLGEPFHIDLAFDNSSDSAVDGLELSMSFDPNFIQIVDTDLDNPITAGINILDGAYQDKFPFDFHINNTVYPSMGRIRYAKGLGNQDALRGVNGVFARIYAIPVKATAGTYLKFNFAASEGYPTTRVTYVGEDVLGDPSDPTDGTSNVVFPILNPRDKFARRNAE